MRSSSIYLFASLVLAGPLAAQGERKPGEPKPVERAAPREAAPEEPAPAVDERPEDAAGLFAAFAAMPGLEARYTEKKHLSLLVVPLESRGRIYFLQPGYMTRLVEAPEESTLVITPDELRMAGRDGTEVIDLHQSDRLKLFVTSLVRVFHGDREAIERLYAVDYTRDEKDAKAWQLRLVPRGKPLSEMLGSLTLKGSGLAVAGFEVVEPNGDRVVTTIVGADPKRTFTADEKAKIFGIRATPEPNDGTKTPKKAR